MIQTGILKIKYMEALGDTKKQNSCASCIISKESRAAFKQPTQSRYALLEAASSETPGPITPADKDGKTFVQIVVEACTAVYRG